MLKKNIVNKFVLINNKSIITVNDTNYDKVLIIKNEKGVNTLLTKLTDENIRSIENILELFNCKYDLITLSNETIDNINKNKKLLIYMGIISEYGEINIKYPDISHGDITKIVIENEISEICKFIEKYSYALDRKIETDNLYNNDTPICESDNSLSDGPTFKPYNYEDINFDYQSKLQFVNKLIRDNSILILYNKLTSEFKIIDCDKDNEEWYSNIMLDKNICNVLNKVNIDVIKFIYYDKLEKDELKTCVINQTYKDSCEIEDEINNHIENIINISSINNLKKIIRENYRISNDIKNLIQFTNVYDKIIEIIKIDNKEDCTGEKEKEIKYILPHVLNDIGLKKKRTSKGMMWYGLNLIK
jgi:hypothetical protein